MFIGYDLDHARDCYKMYNPLTRKYHISRDVKLWNRMYFKNVRFHNTEDLIKLKAGESIIKQESDNLNDVSDNEYIERDEVDTVNKDNMKTAVTMNQLMVTTMIIQVMMTVIICKWSNR